MIHVRRPKFTLAILATLVTGEANATSQADDLQQRARAYVAMVNAETSKSPICRGYEGKPVVLATFDALATRLKGPAAKGEYETTEQYRSRSSATRPVGGPVVLSIPIDRDYLRYDADVGGLIVLAGAFKTGPFSDAAQATIGAEIAMLSAKDSLSSSPRFTIGLPGTEKAISTDTARNAFGATIQTAEINRLTRGISLAGDRLLPFARDVSSMVAMVDVPVVRAPAFKAGLRAAIVIIPEAPFVVSNRMQGAAATNLKPIRYTELSSILIGRPQCALLLNAQSRVVASIDVGSKAGGR